MDSDDSGHSEIEFYYPHEEDDYGECMQARRALKQKKIYYLPAKISSNRKNCALGLEYSPRPAPSGRTLDLGHSLGKTQQKHTIFGLSCSYLKNTLVDPHLLSLESAAVLEPP